MILTKREHEVLTAIQLYWAQNKYPPTIRELSNLIGVASSSTTHRFLTQLKRKGYIAWEPSLPRTLRVLKNVV